MIFGILRRYLLRHADDGFSFIGWVLLFTAVGLALVYGIDAIYKLIKKHKASTGKQKHK